MTLPEHVRAEKRTGGVAPLDTHDQLKDPSFQPNALGNVLIHFSRCVPRLDALLASTSTESPPRRGGTPCDHKAAGKIYRRKITG